MFNWFLETFSTAAEQAKLFSIVISVLLAFCLLITNQWFTARKSKRELLVSKIEELSISIYAYERNSLRVLSSFFVSGPEKFETIEKMLQGVELAEKIEMLCTLYFKEITFDANASQNIISKAHHYLGLPEKEFNNAPKLSYQQSSAELKRITETLKNKTKELMQQYT